MSEPTEREPLSDERTLRDQLVAAGTEAAEQWLSKRAHRRMSEVNRKRLAGHVVGALWQQIEQATVEIAQWLAEGDRAELDRTRAELSARLAAESADAAAGSYAGRAEEAEAALARLRAQLGESGIEWGVQHPLFGTEYIHGADHARVVCHQRNHAKPQQPWRIVTRLAGEWRGEDEPDATRLERYDD